MDDMFYKYKHDIDTKMREILLSKEEIAKPLREAMEYSLYAGGKRVRPVLLMEAARAVGGDPGSVLDYAAAIEFIHTYSLIHDDLPALDDDEYRRGKKTNHKVFGEAMAILAGDGLQALAYEVMLSCIAKSDNMGDEILKKIKAANEIVMAAGTEAMVSGQVMDINSCSDKDSLTMLEKMHRMKTGALITAAVVVGAILAGADERQVAAFRKYGENIGLAFQMVDDKLDVSGDSKNMGKDINADERNEKITYTILLSPVELDDLIKKHTQDAKDAIEGMCACPQGLMQLADDLMLRCG
ncbi:polyprenyl synthetase [Eubacterium saphenum ATCC 49989]|nr:polyprenyl synthetase [Eubacterium saphenum ATCC 49989]